jgi:predicted nucleic acid-binding protein
MKAVVDTNVVVYYLLGTEPFATECRDFWRRTQDVFAPALWHAEIISVLWMAVRKKVITPDESALRLRLAAGLNIHTVPVRQLWRGALLRSIGSDLSTYDTLLVELAIRKGLKLATFDKRVIRTFSSVAARPSTFR